ncbi:MAG: DUF4392 domain-containing protein [Planctomycetaceae bacterium]|nr:DUF4392 domain-containing protein [Planctomycetaceae bacterium]
MTNDSRQSVNEPAIARAESELSTEHAALLNEFERFIHRDPARRGLCATEPDETEQATTSRLGAGQLAAAAMNLALHARKVAIVTGFFIPHAQPPAAETDGPPGSLLLAHCLQALGIEAAVITDAPCAPAVRAAADGIGFPVNRVLVSPLHAESWCDEFWNSEFAGGLTHLVAIERVGPSHTPASIGRQGTGDESQGISNLKSEISTLDSFLADVASEHHDRCHNMRGVCIDGHTAPLHLLFERLPSRHPAARTIGIGDGGNEIGMGAIPWAELRRRLSGEQAGRVPCRIACDFNIVAGTSNWGAMALAAGVCLLRDRLDVLQPWTRERHREWLEHLVANGPAVDGVTGLREATVDGLPFLTYIQPWEGILRWCFGSK